MGGGGAPDNSKAEKAQEESLAIQRDQAKQSKDKQAKLDADIAARRKAARGVSGGGRQSLLTGSELGITKVATLGG